MNTETGKKLQLAIAMYVHTSIVLHDCVMSMHQHDLDKKIADRNRDKAEVEALIVKLEGE